MSGYDELHQSALEVWKAVAAPVRPRLTLLHGTCSVAAGADDTLAALSSEVDERRLDADVAIAGCNGLCFAEPQLEVAFPDGHRVLYHRITADRVPPLLEAVASGDLAANMALAWVGEKPVTGVRALTDLPFWEIQERRLMALFGVIDPEDIDHSLAMGVYSGIARALSMAPEEVIEEVTQSGLRGRSGSDFPTGRKWDFLRGATRRPKYLVCNADEGDPGAWVNRTLMEGDPHSVLEGMLIAAYATGASYGWIYIRDEYPLAIQRMENAIEQARERGLLGKAVLDGDLEFDAEIVRGAGSYVCGEESGLIASIEDMRGMPKIRPPYPAQSGVLGQPTNVNNVETYADAAILLRHSLEWYKSVGTERNPGTKMFTLSGHIDLVGCLEVPLGTPMDRLFEAAGGVAGGRTLKAIQPGGPLAGILPAEHAAIALEPEEFRDLGVQMGGGGLVVIDDSACIIDIGIQFEWFLEDESCGRCTTCHGGTQRLVEILRRISQGGGRPSDLERVRLLADTLRYSNCVHGQASPTIVVNALTFFAEEVRVHIEEKRCPARVCKGLIRYEIVGDGAGGAAPIGSAAELADAADICPTEAIVRAGAAYAINDSKCIRCDACRELAPQAIRVVDAEPPDPSRFLQPGASPYVPVRPV